MTTRRSRRLLGRSKLFALPHRGHEHGHQHELERERREGRDESEERATCEAEDRGR